MWFVLWLCELVMAEPKYKQQSEDLDFKNKTLEKTGEIADSFERKTNRTIKLITYSSWMTGTSTHHCFEDYVILIFFHSEAFSNFTQSSKNIVISCLSVYLEYLVNAQPLHHPWPVDSSLWNRAYSARKVFNIE